MSQSERKRFDALRKITEDAQKYGSILRHISREELRDIQERIKLKERSDHQKKCNGKMVRKVNRIDLREGIETGPPTCEKCGFVYTMSDPKDDFPIVGEIEYWEAKKNWEKVLMTPFDI